MYNFCLVAEYSNSIYGAELKLLHNKVNKTKRAIPYRFIAEIHCLIALGMLKSLKELILFVPELLILVPFLTMDTSDCYLKKHWARTCGILSADGLYNFNRFSNEIMRASVY